MDPRTPPDQHDTLILGSPTGAEPAPAPAPGWPVPVASAWSQIPPFVAPTAAPTVVVKSNNAAVIGATLGSVSLFLSLLPLIGIVAWVLAPIGLISSVIGLLVGMSRKVGRIGSLWGMVTSGVALLVCMAWLALLLAL
ncbi:MAG: hypothetical protein WCF36_09600 [Candidatus Nanopelagicales bacterium]